jgi:hypothetical protein
MLRRKKLKKLPQTLIITMLISLAGVLPGYPQNNPGPPGSAQGQEAAPVFSPYVFPPDDHRETARLNDICRGLENSYDCAQAVERAQLPKYPRQVVRQKGELRLTLKTGKTVVLKDSEEKVGETVSKFIFYSFREHLKNIGYFLVHTQFWEGDGYLMINDRTGRQYRIHDLPILSPDQQRLATISFSVAYNPSDIQIWRLTPVSMTLEWSLEPEDWRPSGGVWLDNDTLTLVKQFPIMDFYKDLTFRQEAAVLQKGPSGWNLEQPAPRQPLK